MTKFGTITYADTEWGVVAFHGEHEGLTMTIGPTPPERPEYIIDDLLDEPGDRVNGYDIVHHLADKGFAIIYTKEAT